MSSAKSNVKKKSEAEGKPDAILIDPQAGLSFSTEEELLEYFADEIAKLEKEYLKYRKTFDIQDQDLEKYVGSLSSVLEDPDEIWEDTKTLKNDYVWFYIKKFGKDEDLGKDLYHVAACYLAHDTPSFVYLHFPTIDEKLVQRFQREEKIFDRENVEAPLGAIDGDALNEGDELAVGLYKAMMLLRSDTDFSEEKFVEYHELREPTIEEPDEIWRNTDSFGNTLVSFVREFPDELSEGVAMWYIVVTLEDSPSNSHALMFSFPTKDSNLVDRYRHGENLQAEEVVQESSH
ncbi:MAG: peptidase [Bdellovibrionales bacterium]|nr:peptidase [Bdellovibrionales bacterium]